MTKKTKPARVKFWYFISAQNIKSLTLIELMVTIIIIGIMIVGILAFEIFSNTQVIDADRRTKLQNQLAYSLEHMSKYVQQGNGNFSKKAIEALPSGFRVNIDLNSIQTPAILTDDGWIDYTLSNNILTATCNANGGNCPFVSPERLTDADGRVTGFQVVVDPSGSLVDISLVGRWDPTGTSLVNPQVEAKTKIICNSSSSH